MALNFNNCGTGGGGGETYTAGPGVKISQQNVISADVRESEIAMVEQSTATEPHEAGEYIIVDNVFYEVTAAIAVDDAIVEGTNVEKTNIGNVLSKRLVVDSVTSPRISLNSGQVSADAVKEGYTPIGVVGWRGSGTANFYAVDFGIYNGTTAQVYLRSINGTAQNVQVTFDVLYIKN